MSKDELDAITRVALARAQSRVRQTLIELRSQYMDADSHALLDVVDARLHEELTMLTPQPEVRQSGK